MDKSTNSIEDFIDIFPEVSATLNADVKRYFPDGIEDLLELLEEESGVSINFSKKRYIMKGSLQQIQDAEAIIKKQLQTGTLHQQMRGDFTSMPVLPGSGNSNVASWLREKHMNMSYCGDRYTGPPSMSGSVTSQSIDMGIQTDSTRSQSEDPPSNAKDVSSIFPQASSTPSSNDKNIKSKGQLEEMDQEEESVSQSSPQQNTDRPRKMSNSSHDSLSRETSLTENDNLKNEQMVNLDDVRDEQSKSENVFSIQELGNAESKISERAMGVVQDSPQLDLKEDVMMDENRKHSNSNNAASDDEEMPSLITDNETFDSSSDSTRVSRIGGKAVLKPKSLTEHANHLEEKQTGFTIESKQSDMAIVQMIPDEVSDFDDDDEKITPNAQGTLSNEDKSISNAQRELSDDSFEIITDSIFAKPTNSAQNGFDEVKSSENSLEGDASSKLPEETITKQPQDVKEKIPKPLPELPDDLLQEEVMMDSDLWAFIEKVHSNDLRKLCADYKVKLETRSENSCMMVIIRATQVDSDVTFAQEKLALLYQQAYDNVYIEIFTLPTKLSPVDTMEAMNAVQGMFRNILVKPGRKPEKFVFLGEERTAREAKREFRKLLNIPFIPQGGRGRGGRGHRGHDSGRGVAQRSLNHYVADDDDDLNGAVGGETRIDITHELKAMSRLDTELKERADSAMFGSMEQINTSEYSFDSKSDVDSDVDIYQPSLPYTDSQQISERTQSVTASQSSDTLAPQTNRSKVHEIMKAPPLRLPTTRPAVLKQDSDEEEPEQVLFKGHHAVKKETSSDTEDVFIQMQKKLYARYQQENKNDKAIENGNESDNNVQKAIEPIINKKSPLLSNVGTSGDNLDGERLEMDTATIKDEKLIAGKARSKVNNSEETKPATENGSLWLSSQSFQQIISDFETDSAGTEPVAIKTTIRDNVRDDESDSDNDLQPNTNKNNANPSHVNQTDVMYSNLRNESVNTSSSSVMNNGTNSIESDSSVASRSTAARSLPSNVQENSQSTETQVPLLYTRPTEEVRRQLLIEDLLAKGTPEAEKLLMEILEGAPISEETYQRNLVPQRRTTTSSFLQSSSSTHSSSDVQFSYSTPRSPSDTQSSSSTRSSSDVRNSSLTQSSSDVRSTYSSRSTSDVQSSSSTRSSSDAPSSTVSYRPRSVLTHDDQGDVLGSRLGNAVSRGQRSVASNRNIPRGLWDSDEEEQIDSAIRSPSRSTSMSTSVHLDSDISKYRNVSWPKDDERPAPQHRITSSYYVPTGGIRNTTSIDIDEPRQTNERSSAVVEKPKFSAAAIIKPKSKRHRNKELDSDEEFEMLQEIASAPDVASQMSKSVNLGSVNRRRDLESSPMTKSSTSATEANTSRSAFASFDEQKVVGRQPNDGTMSSMTDTHFHLEGHRGYGTIQIVFNFSSGKQAGQSYRAAKFYTYVPASHLGKRVVELIQKAFDSKNLFVIVPPEDGVGDNVIIYNKFEPKSCDQGENGYPDDTYLLRANEQLEALVGK